MTIEDAFGDIQLALDDDVDGLNVTYDAVAGPSVLY